MSDLAVPIAIATPIALALTGAVGALWRKIGSVETAERAECAESISKLDARVAKIEQKHDDCEERWRREVQRGAELASMIREADEPPPTVLPTPSWDEPAGISEQRAILEQDALARTFQDFASGRRR